jgi:hypothetical protein
MMLPVLRCWTLPVPCVPMPGTPGAAASIDGLQTNRPSPAPLLAQSPALVMALPAMAELANLLGIRPAPYGHRIAAIGVLARARHQLRNARGRITMNLSHY